MKPRTKKTMVVVLAGILSAILAGVVTYLDDPDEPESIDAGVDAGQVDTWADDMAKLMREDTKRYRDCHKALRKCVNAVSFAVPAVNRLVKNHPELKPEIMDLWAQYYISDAGCCEAEQ